MLKSSSSEFYWHGSAGARILVPSSFSVVQPFPELAACSKGGLPSLIVTIASNQQQLESAERLYRFPPRSTPSQEIEILRKGPISDPYLGQEIIFQSRVTEHPVASYGVSRIVFLDEPKSVFAHIQVTGMGLFREMESLWQKVLDSFAWDAATGLALKFDGDERVFRARVRKKSKRSTKASLPKLPVKLRYLQKVMDNLLSLPPEEVNEDWDSSPLANALQKRVKGMSLEEAENQLDADCRSLKHWMGQDPARFAGEFVTAFMDSFQFELSESENDSLDKR